MVNRQDPHIRTLAQKTQASTRSDLHLQTAAQKEPSGAAARTLFQSIYPQTMGAI